MFSYSRIHSVIMCVLLLISTTAGSRELGVVDIFASSKIESSSDKFDAFDKIIILSGAKRGGVEKKINHVYSRVGQELPLRVTPAVAEIGLFLAFLTPQICSGFEGNDNQTSDGSKLFSEMLSVLSGGDEEYAREIDFAKKSIHLDGKEVLPKQIILMLSMLEVMCESSSAESVDDFAEIKKPSIATVLSDLGMTEEEYNELILKYKKDYKKHGYVEKSDEEIYNIDEHYNANKGFLKSYNSVRKLLDFEPHALIKESTFSFLGAENIGVQSSSGSSSMISIYETKVGKLSVAELDVSASSSETFIAKQSYNSKVGNNDAILSVSKGKYSGEYLSNVFWKTKDSSREFSVQVNLNLNDPDNQKEKKYIFDVLSKEYVE